MLASRCAVPPGVQVMAEVAGTIELSDLVHGCHELEASTGGGVVSERGGDGAGASVEPEAGRAFEAGRRRGEAWSRRPRWCVEVQVQVQVLEQEREVGARWPVAVRRVHLHGLGRLQSELRRPRGDRWDEIAGYFYRKGRTGRREEGCGSMRERYQPGTRR